MPPAASPSPRPSRSPRRWRLLAWPVFSRRLARAAGRRLGALPPAGEGAIRVLFVSDLHGRIGMFRAIGAAARALGASAVLNAGDTTVGGTRLEGALVLRALARAVPAGVPLVVCGGNHDSALTDRQARAAGMVVLDGGVSEAAGLRILGDTDPRWMCLGRTRPKDGRDLAGVTAELVAAARAAADRGEAADLLLVHDPYVAHRVLATGAVPLALTGHLHARRGPERAGSGVLFTSSSTGRDVRQETRFGPLRNDAEMALFDFDARTHRPTGWRLVTLTPGADVVLGPLEAIPDPGAPVPHADRGGPEKTGSRPECADRDNAGSRPECADPDETGPRVDAAGPEETSPCSGRQGPELV